MKRVLVVMLLLTAITGCDFFGPSPKEVKSVLDAIDRGFSAATKDGLKPEVHSEYINKADVTYTSDDKTIVHNVGLFFDTDTEVLKVKGDCNFSDYHDADSGYTINGTMAYNLDGIRKTGIDAMFGEFECEVSLEGGKIKDLSFKLSRSKEGMRKHEMTANGKKIDIENWEMMFNMFDTFRNRRPGR